MPDLIELAGETVSPGELQHPWAAAFARYVGAPENHAFTLVGCRRVEGAEAVAIVVKPEVPQRPRHDIRYEEPLLVLFDRSDQIIPQVLSRRYSFPDVPHLNIRRPFDPKSLCLFDERPEEVQLKWTPALLGERILWWMKETARGTLHGGDQALEPFIGGITRPLIIPPDIFAEADKETLHVYSTRSGPSGEVLIADRPGKGPAGEKVGLFPFLFPPQEHGVIRYEPPTLKHLHSLCQAAGLDLLAQLRKRLQEKVDEVRADSNGTILVFAIPKRRDAAGPIETLEYRGFRCLIEHNNGLAPIGPGKLGEVLGILSPGPAHATLATAGPAKYYPAIAPPEQVDEASEKVLLHMLTLNPVLTLPEAAALSGLPSRDERKVFAVGQGALGSQLFATLAREAWGQWELVDEDYLAPHNSVRHEVFGRRFGLSKAKEMAARANEMFAGPPIAEGIETDILAPGDKAALLTDKVREASIILDMSASVAVGRCLTLNFESSAKRLAAFLSPSGLDLVFMSEGGDRRIPLDVVEAQYLRALINHPGLEGHLASSGQQVRYGGSCGDISARISQETVALHAAVGAKAVRDAAASDESMLAIWRYERGRMTVERHDILLREPLMAAINEWTIVTDAGVIEKVMAFRSAKLPNETCGVLLGHLDTLRRRVYIVDILPAPADSVEERTGCERGIEGLEDVVEHIGERTLRQVTYIGEWHSHPDGAACLPSQRDLIQMDWVRSKMYPEGKPAVMLIACESGHFLYLVAEPHTDVQPAT